MAQQTSFLKLNDVLKLFPVSSSTWYRGIKQGRYPKPIKLSKHASAWCSTDIDALINQVSEGGAA